MGSFPAAGQGTWSFLIPINQIVTLDIILVGGVSDLIDGFLARRWKIVSRFGAMFDQTADMMLFAVAWTIMAAWGCCRWWVVGLVIGNVFIQFYLIIIAREGKMDQRRKLWRKVQISLLFFYFWFCSNRFPNIKPWQGELMRIPVYLIAIIWTTANIALISQHWSTIKMALNQPAPSSMENKVTI